MKFADVACSEVGSSGLDTLVDFTDEGDHCHEFFAALLTLGPEIEGLLNRGHGELFFDDGSEALSVFSVGEPRDVPSLVRGHADVAVLAPSDVAAATEEEDHPAVDDEGESLEENALEPAPDSERQMDQVDAPDEQAGASAAVPAEEDEEDDVEGEIKHGNGEQDCPPGESNDSDDVQVPDPGHELDKEDDKAGETTLAFFLLSKSLGLFISTFFADSGAITVDLLPGEGNFADLEPVLNIALGTHFLGVLVFVVNPLLTSSILRVVTDGLPADAILIDMGELSRRVSTREVFAGGSGCNRRRGSFFTFLPKQGVQSGSCQFS